MKDTSKDSRNAPYGANSLLALAIAIAAAVIYMILASEHPGEALRAFFVSPFVHRTVFLNLLEQAAAPCLCALGAALVFRSGDFNLGGEGQAYAGGLIAVLVLLVFSGLPGFIGITMGLVVGACAGAFISLPSAVSRRLTGSEVLLSTFLVSQTVVFALDWAIAGPLRDPSSNLIATPVLPRAFLLPRLAPPSSLSPALFLAIGGAFALDRFFRRSRRGMELVLYGRNPSFARSIGFPVSGYAFWPLIVSGAFHGFAGALIALGSNGRAVRGMTGGIGWNGISIALVAGNDPRLILPAALLFSWLDAGARQASILSGVSIDVSAVTKALVLLFATARFLKGTSKGKAI